MPYCKKDPMEKTPEVHGSSPGGGRRGQRRAAGKRAERNPTDITQDPTFFQIAGRILKITPRAMATYLKDYGLGDKVPIDPEECLAHLGRELELAMQSEPTANDSRSGMMEYRSPSLIFKTVGSKVVNIRINLKLAGRRKRGGG